MCKFASFGIAQKTPPTGECGLPFALLDDGNGRYAVFHDDTLNIVTVESGVPIKVSKAVYAPSFSFDILLVDVMEASGVNTVLGSNARLEKGKTSIGLSRHRGLF